MVDVVVDVGDDWVDCDELEVSIEEVGDDIGFDELVDDWVDCDELEVSVKGVVEVSVEVSIEGVVDDVIGVVDDVVDDVVEGVVGVVDDVVGVTDVEGVLILRAVAACESDVFVFESSFENIDEEVVGWVVDLIIIL